MLTFKFLAGEGRAVSLPNRKGVKVSTLLSHSRLCPGQLVWNPENCDLATNRGMGCADQEVPDCRASKHVGITVLGLSPSLSNLLKVILMPP